MGNYIYTFLTSLGLMAVFDAIWLGLIAPTFYKRHIGYIMADKPNWLAAVAFYFIFTIGVTVFVVYPGWRDADSTVKIGLMGALLGLVAYATYDLTNQATVKNWPPIVTVVDLVWGAILTAAVSLVAVAILKSLIK